VFALNKNTREYEANKLFQERTSLTLPQGTHIGGAKLFSKQTFFCSEKNIHAQPFLYTVECAERRRVSRILNATRHA
jgi:hypothetical protein